MSSESKPVKKKSKAAKATKALKGRKRGRVTLADVASQAGVATMTASRVISQPNLVSVELRARVEKAVRNLGYGTNRAERALASEHYHVIAVLVPSISH